MSSAQFPSTCPRCGLHEVTVIKEVEGLEERHVGVCYKCGYRWQIPPKEA
jgi:transcription elongation factor Elf1